MSLDAPSPLAPAYADLHLHSAFSDGTFTPEEIADRARQAGLRAVALTDHDTVEGCERMGEACRKAGIEFIAGTELTTELDGYELHLLGYGLDIHHAGLLAQLAGCQTVRQKRIREMVERLNGLNIPLSADAVFALARCGSPGRPHVARALVEAGVCATVDAAFERFLKKHRPAWVPKFKLAAPDAIELIHAAGGLAVMAHPGLNRMDELIPELVAAGLDGVECLHTKHSSAQADHYLRLARQYGLLVTGGSDCHGHTKGRPLIGTVRLPYEHVRRLLAEAGRRKAEARGETPRPTSAPAVVEPA
jgi:predicted metal-dependent phosphoesterase TrpH